MAKPKNSCCGSVVALIIIAVFLALKNGSFFSAMLTGGPASADGQTFNQTPELPTAADATSLVLILDTSGSMDEKVAGGSKIQCAKAVLTEDFLPVLSDDLHVAFYRFDNQNVV